MQSKNEYLLIECEDKKLTDKFLEASKQSIQEDVNAHVILNLQGVNIKKSQASLLIELFRNARSSTRSIILVIEEEFLAYFRDDDPVVPTLEEAEDFLEMENIERALGLGEEEEE